MEYTSPAPIGSVVKGTVVTTRNPSSRRKQDFVLIDVPNIKCTGYLDASELPFTNLEIGQEVEALYLHSENDEGLALLSIYRLQLERAWQSADSWLDNKELVSFEAKEATKGGLIGQVGSIEAFLPASRTDVKKLYHIHRLVGKTFDVQVVEAERERGNIVVSQVLAKEQKSKQAFDNLVVGEHYNLRVDGIADFGAFLELAPGVNGLLHASELSWKKGHHQPVDFLAVDDMVDVVCTRVSKNKAAFSLRRLQDPWFAAADEITIGEPIDGEVTNVKEGLGSFVSLAGYPRVVGLLRGQELARGTQAAFIVHSFDPAKRKASLKLAE